VAIDLLGVFPTTRAKPQGFMVVIDLLEE